MAVCISSASCPAPTPVYTTPVTTIRTIRQLEPANPQAATEHRGEPFHFDEPEIERPFHDPRDAAGALNAKSERSTVATTIASTARRVRWDQFDRGDRQRYRQWRDHDPRYASPFFSLEFIDAVHAARADVVVVVIEDDYDTVGYLPIHVRRRTGYPAGRAMNDAHAVVAPAGVKFDWHSILRQIGLRSIDVHAWVAADQLDQMMIHRTVGSFAAAIGGCGDAFLQRLERQHKTLRKQDQKTRKLAREVGPLCFQFDCEDPRVLQTAIAWKRDQYRRTDILDHFLPPWTRRMLDQLSGRGVDDGCRVVVSGLRAGEHLVAAHVGLVEGDILHYWFPTYDPAFAKYSPGTALFKQVVRHAADHGVAVVDMGYGEQPYKLKQTDRRCEVVVGSIATSSWVHRQRHVRDYAVGLIKSAPGKRWLKRILRTVKPDAGVGKLR